MRKHKRKKHRSDITYDHIFKSIFGSEENKFFAKKLIELITNIKIEKIELYQDYTLEKYSENEKAGRLDVKAIINDEIIVNLEMQNINEGDIEYRTERYGSKIYANSINKGTKYKGAKEVILINILNFRINKHKEFLSKSVSVIDNHRETELKTKLKYYFIELPKVVGDKLDLKDELTQWLIYMYGKDTEVIDMIKKENKEIRKMDKEIEKTKKREERIRMEELRFKWNCDYYYGINKAEERGEKRGKREGIKETAKKMLKLKIAKEIIMQVTGLKSEELEKLYV